jgi:hypothetical protein
MFESIDFAIQPRCNSLVRPRPQQRLLLRPPGRHRLLHTQDTLIKRVEMEAAPGASESTAAVQPAQIVERAKRNPPL